VFYNLQSIEGKVHIQLNVNCSLILFSFFFIIVLTDRQRAGNERSSVLLFKNLRPLLGRRDDQNTHYFIRFVLTFDTLDQKGDIYSHFQVFVSAIIISHNHKTFLYFTLQV